MQAFLITAYKDYEQLYELVTYLAENNKVFIHVDRSSKEILPQHVEQLNGIYNCEAIATRDICWGSFTHVEAIMDLMKVFKKRGFNVDDYCIRCASQKDTVSSLNVEVNA